MYNFHVEEWVSYFVSRLSLYVYNGGDHEIISVDELISDLPETTNGKGVARNFESTGGYEQTVKDLKKLNPVKTNDIQTQYGSGKVGTLENGTTIVARPGSKTGGSTLEIKISNKNIFKIPY